MQILETERLLLREIISEDAAFVLDLLNQPSFIKYIGDRGVSNLDQSRDFIEIRYRQSYQNYGYGLYTVELKEKSVPIGICGFVKRDTLPHPDIGFAFLPQYERKGYAFESAAATVLYGREILGFDRILAITSLDNARSGQLLAKLSFSLERIITMPDGENLKLFASSASDSVSPIPFK